MGKLSTAFKAMLAAQFLPRLARAATDVGGPATALHYRPLNGDSLREMARLRPATHHDLLMVHGIGESKAERFGQALLETVAEATGGS